MVEFFAARASAQFPDEEEAKEVKHMARAGRAGTGGQCRHAGQAQNRALGLRHGRRSEHRIGRCEPRERADRTSTSGNANDRITHTTSPIVYAVWWPCA